MHKEGSMVIARLKRTYIVPKLQVYGDIREITKAVGTTSTIADKPSGGTNKTH